MNVPTLRSAALSSRRLLGLAILATTFAIAGVTGHAGRNAAAARFTVPFARGETPAPGADAVELAAASLLRAYPRLSARLTGYVDAGGDDAANAALSERRAQVVRDALASEGVETSRLHAVGGGASGPTSRSDGIDDPPPTHREARVEVVMERD